MSEQTEIGTAVATREATEVQRPRDMPDVAKLMETALAQGPEGVDALEKLVDLQMRILDRQAESALIVALAEFKDACPEIKKTRRVKYATSSGKEVDFWFAPLEAIQKTADPYLHRVGLSYTFDTEDRDGKSVLIRGRLQHVDGAYREATVTLPVAGMQDSPAQRYAGTISYGKRYVLSALLGLTIEDDVDGQQAGPTKAITAAQVADLEALIEEVGADRDKFLVWLRVGALSELPASHYGRAVKALEAKR